MIISRKEFNLRVQEEVAKALRKAEQEAWMKERLNEMERHWSQRHDELCRHCWELEKKIATLMDEKGGE